MRAPAPPRALLCDGAARFERSHHILKAFPVDRIGRLRQRFARMFQRLLRIARSGVAARQSDVNRPLLAVAFPIHMFLSLLTGWMSVVKDPKSLINLPDQTKAAMAEAKQRLVYLEQAMANIKDQRSLQ